MSTPSRMVIAEGKSVMVKEEFVSVNRDPIPVKAGMWGLVIHIDNEGGAQMAFDGIGRRVWLLRYNYKNLVKDKSIVGMRSSGIIETRGMLEITALRK